MTVFILTLAVMGTALLAMSIGVMISGRRLRGSCGGLASGSCACRDQGIEPNAACPKRAADERLYAIGVSSGETKKP